MFQEIEKESCRTRSAKNAEANQKTESVSDVRDVVRDLEKCLTTRP